MSDEAIPPPNLYDHVNTPSQVKPGRALRLAADGVLVGDGRDRRVGP